MDPTSEARWTAFEGTRRLASGSPLEVALAIKSVEARGPAAPVLVFEDATGRQIDLDLRGTPEELRGRFAAQGPEAVTAEEPRRRGRPRLGVVSREVTLLPRQWAWLAEQRGGASATLRRLVEEARKAGERQGRTRRAQDAAYRFMSAMAGNLPGFEEAIRALFAGDRERLGAHTKDWPDDVGAHTMYLAADAFPAPTAAQTLQGDA